MFNAIVRNTRRSASHRPYRGGPRPPVLVLEGLEARDVPSLDQVFDPDAMGGPTLSTSVAYFNTDQEMAQTFTVGATGRLTRVDFYGFRFSGDIGPLVLDIRGTQADGRPTSGAGQQLLTTSVPAPDVPGGDPTFVAIDLSGFNLNVVQGQELAIALHVGPSASGDVTYWWGGRTEDPYPGGVFYERVIGNHDWIAMDPGWDLGFKTWVDAAPQQSPDVTLPGGPVAYTEDGPPTLLAAGATVTDPDSPNFDTGTLTVSLTANGAADNRLGVRNEGTAAGQIGVSGSTVTFGGTAIGTFTGGVGTTPLVFTLNASATPAATEALVHNLTFHTVSDTPTTNPRTVELVLTDGDGGTSFPDMKTVTVTPANDAPTIATNTGVTVLEGGPGLITAAKLTAADPDNTPVQLVYTVTAGPTHGTLLRFGLPATSFTQADINSGSVTYQHSGDEAPADGFTFTVSDGTATTAPATFAIPVNPVNDPPVVTTNAGLTVVQNSIVTITPDKLAAADPDNGPAELTYTVVSPPAHGTIRLNNLPTSTFTQADIAAGLVSYRHDGSIPVPDGFTFVVFDGSLPTASTTVAITVVASSGPVVTVSDFDPGPGTVTFTGDGGDDLNDHLELFAVDLGGGQFALGHNLTDADLESNTDLDPATPGVQQLILGSGSAPLITVNLLTGDDSLGIDNAGGHFTTPVAFDGGIGHDLLRLDGTLANTWGLTGSNAGSVTGTAASFTAVEDLTGSDGDDIFVFGAATDIGRLDGRGGTNTLDYGGLTTPVEVFLPSGSASQTAGVAGIQRILGGSAPDLLVGGAAGVAFVGGSGDDTLLGGAGNDVLTGGAGNDLLAGGGGLDQVAETMPSVPTVTLTNTSLIGGTDTGVDVLIGIESARLTGGIGNNVIRASAFTLGPVTLNGGAGNDKLYGGTQGDLLIGGDGKDNLIGGAGNDTFTGGLGNDILNGGAGDDLVRETDITGANVTLSSSKLKVTDSALGADTLISIGRAFLSLVAGETVGRTLKASGFRAGPVTLVGGGGADTLIGTSRAGDLLGGGGGADTLNSGKGADTVDGGADIDLHVTLGGAAIGDTVIDIP